VLVSTEEDLLRVVIGARVKEQPCEAKEHADPPFTAWRRNRRRHPVHVNRAVYRESSTEGDAPACSVVGPRRRSQVVEIEQGFSGSRRLGRTKDRSIGRRKFVLVEQPLVSTCNQ
jgi:hypothetical protein